MKCFHVASLLLGSISVITGQCLLDHFNSEVIMKMPAEDGFPNKLYEGESLSAYDAKCRLKLNRDGNLVVSRYVSLDSVPGYVPVSHADEYDTFRTAWSTGAHGTGDYVASLQGDGNFVVYGDQGNGNQAMFKTRSAIPKTETEHPNHSYRYSLWGPSDTFTLAFRPDCSLVLMRYYERVVNGNVNVYSRTTWSNFRQIENSYPPFNSIIQKGEMLKACELFCSPILMKHYPRDPDSVCVPVPLVAILKQNCNLEIYIGHDMADAMTRVWTSNTPRSDLDDCYFYAFDEGPALVEGAMNPLYGKPNSSKKYWSMFVEVSDIDDDDQSAPGSYELTLHTTGFAGG